MTLRANRLVAVAAEDGSLDSAWTEAGPVTVVEGRRQARSGKAHFLGNGQRLVLTGQPKLTEGDSFLEGERVIFHVGLDRVEVERPRAAFPLDRAAGRSEK
jgi:lipopolysaccharide export system protein LptA